jgi:hypothetical protein
MDGKVVGTLKRGDRRQVLDGSEGWIEIKEGWVRADLVK